MANTRAGNLMAETIRHQIFLQRYNSGVVRRMLALLTRTDRRIIEELARIAGTADAFALETALENIRRLHGDLRAQLLAFFSAEGVPFAAYEAAWALRAMTVGASTRPLAPSAELVRAAAMSRPFQSVHLRWANIAGHTDEFMRRRNALVRDLIRQAAVRGDSIPQIIIQLREVLPISQRTAETIARTAMNHISNAAREEVYIRNAHLLEGVMWTAVLDHRTSAVCRARDGVIYPPNSGPRPPAHPNCRSTTVSIFKGEPRPDLPTYGDWLRQQDRETIEEILGKKKAALFLDGGLTLDRFVDASGKEYTLAQLKLRDAAAWKKAGLE